MLQNGQLMGDTIFNNIAGSRPLSLDDAWNAARMAGIEDDIRQMPMGIHTFINEGSTNISGGQKQRILIARALAMKPRILFFDEATSALDNISQKMVIDNLKNLNLTKIIIAHRLSSIISADQILVLDQGRIVESGTYNELMACKGYFAELVKRQLA